MQDGLFAFERTYLERLRLASKVILELGEDGQISDGLQVELQGFKEQVELALLQPVRPAKRPLDRPLPRTGFQQ